MVRHIVFWKLKEDAAGGTKEANAQRVKELLEDLRGKVPGLLRIEVGFDFSQTAASMDVALYSEFESREALDGYQDHPDHVKAKDFIRSVTDARSLVDYEL